MFMVARRKGQRIVIGDDIEVIVTELSRSVVRLGIRAPASLQILRGEIHDSIVEANQHALESELTESPEETTTTVAAPGAFAPTAGNARPLPLAAMQRRAPLCACTPRPEACDGTTAGASAAAARCR